MSGPECCSNAPILNPTSGVGHVEKLGGLDTYVTGHSHSKLAILMVSEIFGFEAPKLRKLADKVAATGYYVVEKAFEDAKPVIDALKHKGVLSIGAASFCWGAKSVVELAKSRLIQAGVLLHPSFITLDDIKGVNIPIAILGAEIDKYCPPELLQQFEQLLTVELGVDCYVKLFPDVSDGWTISYNNEDAMAIKAADEAHQNLLDWFAKHVK